MLGIEGIATPIALETQRGLPVLVLRDAGPTDLETVLGGRPASVEFALSIGIELSAILARVHAAHVVHGDVAAANVVLGADGTVTLVDFETAIRMDSATEGPGAGSFEGELPYAAPEQTGRMRCLVDARADLYGLGAVLYEVLTGVTPFQTRDPGEMVHHHLARRPRSPTTINPRVPPVVSALVLKLLEKSPDRRYPTATSLRADLEHVRSEWLETGRVRPFSLAAAPRDLVFPDRLYGRDGLRVALVDALDRLSEGESVTCFVGGRAGTGKTALAESFRRDTVTRGGRFLVGKFDAGGGRAPYATILEAFRPELRSIVGSSPESRARWRERLEQALSPNVGVLAAGLPELEALLGPASPPLDANPAEAERRFQHTLRALIAALSSADAPMVLFLDDIHWADPASCRLIRDLVFDPGGSHRLLLLTYRTEELDIDHAAMLDELVARASGRALVLRTTDLDLAALTELLAETLGEETDRVLLLARTVLEKTDGNPFFVRQLLSVAVDAELLRFHPASRRWEWDADAIARRPVTENVAELLVAELTRLPRSTRDLLATGACLGHRIDSAHLARLRGIDPAELEEHLAPALRIRMLTPVRACLDGPRLYVFAHDRVQQAALDLLSPEARERRHGALGRRMLQVLSAEELDAHFFEVVEQLSLGAAQRHPKPERLRFASLALEAGSRARRAGAYGSALRYLARGIEALPADGWGTHPTLAHRLHRDGAECAHLTGATELGERLMAAALEHARDRFEEAELYDVGILAAAARGASEEALRLARIALRRFDVDFPTPDDVGPILSETAGVREALGTRAPTDLLDAPSMRDRDALVCMRLLTDIAASVFFSERSSIAWLLARMVRLSVERGNTALSANAYLGYGAFLFAMGDEETGYAFGGLGLALARRSRDPRVECQASMLFAAHLAHWRRPLRASVPLVERGIDVGTAAGELQYTGYLHATLAGILFSSGAELPHVLEAADRGQAFYGRHGLTVDVMPAYRQAARCLMGGTEGRNRFDDSGFHEEDFLRSTNRTALAVYATVRLQTSYLLGSARQGIEWSDAAAGMLEFALGFFTFADHNFYTSLALAALADREPSPDVRRAFMARIETNQQKLVHWAQGCDANFRHKHALVEAELARLRGDRLAAAAHYEEAMVGAAREGFLQDEALANELAGRAYRSFGLARSAERCLHAAVDLYGRWGATSKVQALEEEFGELRRAEALHPRAEIGSGAELDLFRILKSAATIASEVDLERLLETLIGMCVEAAGAEMGVLVLEEAEGPFVRASWTSAGSRLVRDPLDRASDIPAAILAQVRANKETLLLRDPAEDVRFASDPYVRRRRPRAVFVLPLLRQGSLVGTLYFENDVNPDVFTAARVNVLEVLATHASIAIELSLLVERLRMEVKERARAEQVVRFVAEASAAFAESLELDTVLARIAEQAVPFLGAHCVVQLMDRTRGIARTVHAHADASHDPSNARALIDANLLAAVVEEGSQSSVDPGRSDDDEFAAAIGEDGRRLLALPLRAGARLLGAMGLADPPSGRFDSPDVAVAEFYAGRASTALENALLYTDAQQAIRTRDDFLSVASHELNTPVTSMKLALQALASNTLPHTPENLERVFRLTLKQTSRLTRLVGDLLDVARIQSGRLALHLQTVDLVEVVREAAERLAEDLARSRSTITIHGSGPARGCWDPGRLDQIVTNLLANAIKFGEHRSIHVEIGCDESSARLAITDHGIGIAPEHVGRIFERFERGVSADQFGGLGLGLFIVKGFVSALGGEVRVESELGRGSTFFVELPVRGTREDAR